MTTRTGCRVTGPGMEYAGNVNVTKSGHPCVKWTDANPQWPDPKFPDGSRALARDRCRNPSGDPGGPWCYAAMDGHAVIPDYCDAALCDDDDDEDDGCGWTLVVGGSARGHYTTVAAAGDGNARFALRAWLPVAAGQPPFRLSLAVYPTGVVGADGGFEVSVPAAKFVSARGTAIRFGLSWRHGYVSLTTGRSAEEVLGFELDDAQSVAQLAYVGVATDVRAPVAVRLPFCGKTGAA